MSVASYHEIVEPEPEEKKQPFFYRSWKAYSTLVGGFIYMIYLGSIMITGNISAYIADYFTVSTTKTSHLNLYFHIMQAFVSPFGTWII